MLAACRVVLVRPRIAANIHRAVRRLSAGLGVAYIGMMGLLFLGAARHTPEILRDEVRVFGLIMLLYAAVAWIRHGVAQAELRTAEKLLEIELRLAEIGETRKPTLPQDQLPQIPERPA